MAPVTFTTRASLVAGNPENIGDVTDCLDKLLAGVNSVSDSQLASPAGSVWRTIHEAPFAIAGSSTAAAYWFNVFGAVQSGTATSTVPAPFIFLDPTAYAVTGKTAQMRVHVSAMSGASIVQTPTFGLYPIASVSGSTNSVGVTLTAAVSGSTVAVAPVANTGSAVGVSSSFAVPAAGTGYILGCTLAGTTSNGMFTGTIRLELSYT